MCYPSYTPDSEWGVSRARGIFRGSAGILTYLINSYSYGPAIPICLLCALANRAELYAMFRHCHGPRVSLRCA